MADPKIFFNSVNSQYFFVKISWIVGLIDAMGIDKVNLYGREAARHKLKNGQKTQKMYFLPVFELMLGSLTSI